MGAANSRTVALAGLPSSGKTCFMYTLLHGEVFGATESTGAMVNEETLMVEGEQPIVFKDVGGECSVDRVVNVARTSSALVFFVDATDETKVLEAAWELYYLAKQLPPELPVLVLLNSKRRKTETGAIPFEALFPVFEPKSLPPGTKERTLDELFYLTGPGERTGRGFIVSDKRSKLRRSGPWNVLPLFDATDAEESRKVFSWLTLNMVAQ